MTRKSFLNNRVSNGFSKTTTGSGSVAVDLNMKGVNELVCEGKTEYAWTPSVDKPCDGVSVGEMTENLFNGTSTQTYKATINSYTPSSINFKNINKGGYVTLIFNGLEIGEIYTIRIDCDRTDAFWRVYAWAGANASANHTGSGVLKWDIKTRTFTATSEYIYLGCYGAINVDGGEAWLDVDTEIKATLVKGSYTNATMPTYQPYGYQIGVLCESQLFDLTDALILSNWADTYHTSYNYYDLKCESGKSYTITMHCNVKGINLRLGRYDGQFTQLKSFNSLGIQTYTFTSQGNEVLYVYFSGYMKQAQLDTMLQTNFTDIFVYDSNKTPICLPMYIGSTALMSGEKVSVNWEKQEAWRDSINLLNENDANNQFGYLDVNGNIIAHSTIKYTDYVPIDATKEYINFSAPLSGRMFAPSICFYDNDKVFISGKALSNSADLDIPIPSNAKYCRMCYRINYPNITMYEYGTVAHDYIAYEHQDIKDLNTTTLNTEIRNYPDTNVMIDTSDTSLCLGEIALEDGNGDLLKEESLNIKAGLSVDHRTNIL